MSLKQDATLKHAALPPRISSENPFWIFGYGSLIWRTGFSYAECRPAFIHDWSRRFWQGSTDHRGVPGAPGRVVTLIEQPGAICWGRAYRLEPKSLDVVLAQLDHREQGGYERLRLPLHFSDTESTLGITWHATAENDHYLGEAAIPDIARQVSTSRGPSGSNIDYVLKLHAALNELGVEDAHVTELVKNLLPL